MRSLPSRAQFSTFTGSVQVPLTVNVIYPCNEVDIVKYSAQERRLVRETADAYERITLPYVKTIPAKQTAWVTAILRGEAEADRVICEDDAAIVVPDTKWDRRDQSQLHVLALVKDGSIRSVRDLRASHVPMLKAMKRTVLSKLGIAPSEMRVFMHYLPSFWHAHIHFSRITNRTPTALGKSLWLDDIIDNLEADGDFYRNASLTIALGEREPLYGKFMEAGMLS